MMSEADRALCPVYEAVDVLQEKWVLHIVRNLLSAPHGFNQLSRAVGGCNSKTLAQRLERLEALGTVKKTVCSMMPPRTEYELTQAGMELHEVIDAIDRWSRRHLDVLAQESRTCP